MFKTMLMGMMILVLTSIAAAQSGDYKDFLSNVGYGRSISGGDLVSLLL